MRVRFRGRGRGNLGVGVRAVGQQELGRPRRPVVRRLVRDGVRLRCGLGLGLGAG